MNQTQIIQSRQNKTAKEIISLRDKKQRRKQQRFTIEGFRFVQEALLSGVKVEKICYATDVADKFRQEFESLVSSEIQCFEVEHGLFRQLAETDSPQGLLAIVHTPERSLEQIYRKGFRGLILDNVQDPGNAGTIIRSAHALGFDAVAAISGTVDIYNSKVLRSTMGSIFHIPVMDNLHGEELFSFCSEKNLSLIASRLENAKSCHETELSGEFFLIIGNEGNGVSESMLAHATEMVYIPMPGGAESLNAAIAASIIMYESNRQRLIKQSVHTNHST